MVAATRGSSGRVAASTATAGVCGSRPAAMARSRKPGRVARATLPGFRERAIAAGLDPQTPTVAVLAATRPDEKRVAATIADLPERLGELPANGPVLVLLGHAFGPALSAANPAEDRRRA